MRGCGVTSEMNVGNKADRQTDLGEEFSQEQHELVGKKNTKEARSIKATVTHVNLTKTTSNAASTTTTTTIAAAAAARAAPVGGRQGSDCGESNQGISNATSCGRENWAWQGGGRDGWAEEADLERWDERHPLPVSLPLSPSFRPGQRLVTLCLKLSASRVPESSPRIGYLAASLRTLAATSSLTPLLPRLASTV
ncbi:hypothetical protein O3P69_008992 [Scylla paramamosain]|uniref:Uncharacterized protein n=1 Tax=Scylla paramamosain TaxID=85552 RepID=A0AAW0TTP5_SCYPA